MNNKYIKIKRGVFISEKLITRKELERILRATRILQANNFEGESDIV